MISLVLHDSSLQTGWVASPSGHEETSRKGHATKALQVASKNRDQLLLTAAKKVKTSVLQFQERTSAGAEGAGRCVFPQ